MKERQEKRESLLFWKRIRNAPGSEKSKTYNRMYCRIAEKKSNPSLIRTKRFRQYLLDHPDESTGLAYRNEKNMLQVVVIIGGVLVLGMAYLITKKSK